MNDLNENESYDVKPTPLSSCWNCKYYDIKNLFCNNLRKQTSPFSLCPDTANIPVKDIKSRKKFLCDNLLCAVTFNKNKPKIKCVEKGELYSICYEFDKDVPKKLQRKISNRISNLIKHSLIETIDNVEWLNNTLLKVKIEVHGFYPALFYIKVLINAMINNCIDTFVEM